MTTKPRPDAPDAPDADYSRKARLLLDLLGRERLEDLSRKGLGARLLEALPDADGPGADGPGAEEKDAQQPYARGSRREAIPAGPAAADLIDRFRRGGLIEADPAGAAPPPEPAPVPRPAPPRPGLASRLAEALGDGASLADEHPAVVAFLLRDQSAGLRARVLRALPGPGARRVMRHLRAMSEPSGPGPGPGAALPGAVQPRK